MVKRCKICRIKIIKTRKNHSNFKNQKYCSNKCKIKGLSNDRRFIFHCPICNKSISRIKSDHHVTCSKECGYKYISIKKMGEQNPMWKGDNVGYLSLHEWVRNRKQEPDKCDCCKIKKVRTLDLANISGKYTRELSDWEYLCRRCHMKKDGRMRNLKHNK